MPLPLFSRVCGDAAPGDAVDLSAVPSRTVRLWRAQGLISGTLARLTTAGAQKVTPPRTVRMTVRLSESDRAALEGLAESWGTDLTTAITRAVWAALEENR